MNLKSLFRFAWKAAPVVILYAPEAYGFGKAVVKEVKKATKKKPSLPQ